MTSLKIRQAGELDIPFIQYIAAKTWKDTYADLIPEEMQQSILGKAYSSESLAASINRGDIFLIALMGLDPVGFIDLQVTSSDPGTLLLHRLYVLPDTQRQGVGKELLSKAVAMATGRLVSPCSAYTIKAHVERDNTRARAFYKKMGFVEGDEEFVTIGGVALPVISIAKVVRFGQWTH